MFNATDTVSGIDHYVAIYDGVASSTIALSDLQNGVYTAPPLLAGKHIVEIERVRQSGKLYQRECGVHHPGRGDAGDHELPGDRDRKVADRA